MPNIKNVNIGQNKFCGPAVLSILTGKDTDTCARVISKINGQYNVTGVMHTDLISAAHKMGFISTRVMPQGSLFRTISSIINKDGMYVISVPGHFVCIEIAEKKAFFCDNHTKEVIPAGSSARLGQQVDLITKVEKDPNFVEEKLPVLEETFLRSMFTINYDNSIGVAVHRYFKYDRSTFDRQEIVCAFNLKNIGEVLVLMGSLGNFIQSESVKSKE